ncbi:MAG: lytic transglycosylase domain-containing protein [Clostridia bacterium]|nr:lytic transglycosylase domain-containing protein [Clostridia bacterium]
MLIKHAKPVLTVLLVLALLLTATSCTAVEKRLYPLEHKELIEKYAEKHGMPPELLAAVIKTESGFDENARSRVGAIGLMQLMPSTAEEIAWRMGVEYDASALTDPETNISYGTYYLKHLYDLLGADWDNACAAYNAGIGRVTGWLKNEEYCKDGKTLSYIPIEETRNYVNKINNYKEKYKKLYFDSEGDEQ